MVCAVCRKEIDGLNPLADGLAKVVWFYRHGQKVSTGYAHHEPCALYSYSFDVTGQPYYNEGIFHAEHPALPENLSPTARGDALDDWALGEKAREKQQEPTA